MEEHKKLLLGAAGMSLLLSFWLGVWVGSTAENKRVRQMAAESRPVDAAQPAVTPAVKQVSLPEVTSGDEVITKAVLNPDCQIAITTSKGQKFFVPTEYQSVQAGTACNNSPMGKISPSGKYLAYSGMSGGVDELFAVFALPYAKSFTLGVWGTSTVMDYMFLPDGKLAVIDGYPDTYDEQSLILIDIPRVFSNLSDNFDTQIWYLTPKNPTLDASVRLPNTGENHAKLAFTDGMIQTRSEQGRLLAQYDPEEVIMDGSLYGVSASLAKKLVYQTDAENAGPGNSGQAAQQVDVENSTRETWVVRVIDKKTGSEVRRYQVNAKTGEVARVGN